MMKAAILGISGTRLTPEERSLFQAMPPAGIILFARNIAHPVQLADLVADLRTVLVKDAVLMVDQEGGRVARLRAPHWPELPPAATLGALFATDPAAARNAARAHGSALGALAREAGFDVVTAPVLDVPVPSAHDVIGDRAISSDPIAVGALGADIAWGLMLQGVQPVMKHIPGHGRATVDSHKKLPRVSTRSIATDCAPFAANNDLPWAMTAHIVYEALDPENPATFSEKIIQTLIREQIGFKGILISDDLAMGAIDGPPASRAERALAAGCDLALYCSGNLEANRAILEACHALEPGLIFRMKARPAS